MRRTSAAKPEARHESERLGLAFSGGGLRATLFHLGVVRWLAESNRLRQIEHVSSVSGGSIMAAHLLLRWEDYTDLDRFDAAAAEIIRFARYDVRGRIMRRLPALFVRSLFPPARASRLSLFASYLDRLLFKGSLLRHEDDTKPSLSLLATNLTTGGPAAFTSSGFMPDYVNDSETLDSPIPMSLAVAISSAFPGFFPPCAFDHESLFVAATDFPHQHFFTDGGVYDNLGVRWFQHLQQRPGFEPLDQILISDASGAFEWDTRRNSPGLLATAMRATEIFMWQITEREFEHAAQSRNGTPLQILRISDADEVKPCLEGPYQAQLKHIRTDLDAFSDLEIRMLVRHGYEIAKGEAAGGAFSWDPICQDDIPLDRGTVRKLWKGRNRRLRLFSLKDPHSWVHLLIAVLLVAVIAFEVDALVFTEASPGFIDPLVAEQVPRLPPIPNPRAGLLVLTDSRTVDLTRWKRVTGKTAKESPVLWTRTVLLKKTADLGEVRFRFASSGVVDLTCLTHKATVEMATPVVPDAGHERLFREYHLVVDIESEPINVQFAITIQTVFWRSFQGSKENPDQEFIVLNPSGASSSMSLQVIAPEDKQLRDLKFARYKRPTADNYEGRTSVADANVQQRDNKVYWRIANPLPGYYYRVSWNW